MTRLNFRAAYPPHCVVFYGTAKSRTPDTTEQSRVNFLTGGCGEGKYRLTAGLSQDHSGCILIGWR